VVKVAFDEEQEDPVILFFGLFCASQSNCHRFHFILV